MNRFSNILFIATSSKNNSTAFEQATKIAQAYQAKITVVGMLSDFTSSVYMATELLSAITQQRREELEQLIRNTPLYGLDVEIKVLSGRPFIEIIQEVIEFDRDLVIKPIDHGKGLGSGLFSGTDMKLLRKCPCPVWLIKSAQQDDSKEILVGLDYEPENPENNELNLRIMDIAISLALSELCELHIVHAWHFANESFMRSPRMPISDAEVDDMIKAEANLRETWLSETVENCLAAHGNETNNYLKPQLHVLRGRASNIVPALAKQIGAELIVMGTIARTGVPGYLIGNTAETILNRIDSSVLAVKPQGFVSPIKTKSN